MLTERLRGGAANRDIRKVQDAAGTTFLNDLEPASELAGNQIVRMHEEFAQFVQKMSLGEAA